MGLYLGIEAKQFGERAPLHHARTATDHRRRRRRATAHWRRVACATARRYSPTRVRRGRGWDATGRSEPDRVGLRGVPAATATVLHTGAVRRTHISPVHLRDGAPTLEERSLSAVALGPAADCNSQHLCSPAACPRTHASGPALPVGPAPPCQQAWQLMYKAYCAPPLRAADN